MVFKAVSCEVLVILVICLAVVNTQEQSEDQELSGRRYPRQLAFPGPVNFSQRRPSRQNPISSWQNQQNFNPNSQQNFGQNRPSFGQNQQNFGQNRPNFGQNQQGFGQNRPNFGPTGESFTRTTRQADFDDDQFVFDRVTTRPGAGTTRRPSTRPTRPVRPTTRPRPTSGSVVQSSTDTQFPFVAQSVVSECQTNCHRLYVTNEYNPICGNDGNTYTNPGKLLCAERCGKNVVSQFSGACPGLNNNVI